MFSLLILNKLIFADNKWHLSYRVNDVRGHHWQSKPRKFILRTLTRIRFNGTPIVRIFQMYNRFLSDTSYHQGDTSFKPIQENCQNLASQTIYTTQQKKAH